MSAMSAWSGVFVLALMGCGGESSEDLEGSDHAFTEVPGGTAADTQDHTTLKGVTLQVETELSIAAHETVAAIGPVSTALSNGYGWRSCAVRADRGTVQPRIIAKGNRYTVAVKTETKYYDRESQHFFVDLELTYVGTTARPDPFAHLVNQRADFSIRCGFWRAPTDYRPTFGDVVSGITPQLKIAEKTSTPPTKY